MELTRSAQWEFFPNTTSLEDFTENYLPKIIFKEEVSDHVKNNFTVVQKLLIHSYFEYEFWDVATAKCLMTLEMALEIRYKEIENRERGRLSFQNLLQYFFDRSFFETENPRHLDHIRWCRNHLAHPERYSFSGPIGNVNLITDSVYLINDLYEDIELRKERINERDRVNQLLIEFMNEGALLYDSNNDVHSVYDISVVFVNNKRDKNTYYIMLLLEFDIRQILRHPYPNQKYLFIECNNIDQHNDQIIFNDAENPTIILTKHPETAKLLKWKNELYRNVDFHSHINHISTAQNDYYLLLRRNLLFYTTQ